MAIAFDNGDDHASTTAASQTFAFTSSSAAAGYMVIGVTGSTTTDKITGITYNNVALTKLDSGQKSGDRWESVWYLLSPASGANNVVITNSSSDFIQAKVVTLTGISQVPPQMGTQVTGTAASFTTTITPNTAGSAVLTYGSYAQRATASNNADTTARAGGSATGLIAEATGDPSTGATTLHFKTSDSSSQAYIAFPIALAPYVASPVAPVFLLNFM